MTGRERSGRAPQVRPFRLCLRLLGGDNWLGGVYYTQNLIRCLATLPADQRRRIHITLEHNRGDEKHADPVREHVDAVHAYGTTRRAARAGLRLILGRVQERLPLRLKPRYDFVYPASVNAPGISSGAGWIPDFQHRHLPDLFPKEEIEARDRANMSIASRLSRVVLSSEMAVQDFARFYPASAHKARLLRFVSVIDETWLASRPAQAVERRRLPERFFLVSNQFWVHKNHALVIAAAGECRRRGVTIPVVFTGGFHEIRAQGHVDVLRRQIEDLQITESMHILGQIPRAEQIQLFRACLAVLQPSKFEGWSTVVEDARALGKLTFMSDFPVHLEQAPPGGRYFSQVDPCQLADLMIERWNDPRPGFDAAAEARALEHSVENRRRVAEQFLTIAEEGRA